MKKMSINNVRSKLFELNCCKEFLDHPAFWCYQNNTSLGISNNSDDSDSFMYIDIEYDYEREEIQKLNFVIKAYSREALEENYVYQDKKEQQKIVRAINRIFPFINICFTCMVEQI